MTPLFLSGTFTSSTDGGMLWVRYEGADPGRVHYATGRESIYMTQVGENVLFYKKLVFDVIYRVYNNQHII